MAEMNHLLMKMFKVTCVETPAMKSACKLNHKTPYPRRNLAHKLNSRVVICRDRPIQKLDWGAAGFRPSRSVGTNDKGNRLPTRVDNVLSCRLQRSPIRVNGRCRRRKKLQNGAGEDESIPPNESEWQLHASPARNGNRRYSLSMKYHLN